MGLSRPRSGLLATNREDSEEEHDSDEDYVEKVGGGGGRCGWRSLAPDLAVKRVLAGIEEKGGYVYPNDLDGWSVEVKMSEGGAKVRTAISCRPPGRHRKPFRSHVRLIRHLQRLRFYRVQVRCAWLTCRCVAARDAWPTVVPVQDTVVVKLPPDAADQAAGTVAVVMIEVRTRIGLVCPLAVGLTTCVFARSQAYGDNGHVVDGDAAQIIYKTVRRRDLCDPFPSQLTVRVVVDDVAGDTYPATARKRGDNVRISCADAFAALQGKRVVAWYLVPGTLMFAVKTVPPEPADSLAHSDSRVGVASAGPSGAKRGRRGSADRGRSPAASSDDRSLRPAPSGAKRGRQGSGASIDHGRSPVASSDANQPDAGSAVAVRDVVPSRAWRRECEERIGRMVRALDAALNDLTERLGVAEVCLERIRRQGLLVVSEEEEARHAARVGAQEALCGRLRGLVEAVEGMRDRVDAMRRRWIQMAVVATLREIRGVVTGEAAVSMLSAPLCHELVAALDGMDAAAQEWGVGGA